MEGFWTCSDCGSANLYPDIKECEVCGKQIDDYEIKQAEKHFREALKTQEQIKRNEEREERLCKQQELEKKRKTEFERKQKEKQKRLQEKIQKNEKNIKKSGSSCDAGTCVLHGGHITCFEWKRCSGTGSRT